MNNAQFDLLLKRLDKIEEKENNNAAKLDELTNLVGTIGETKVLESKELEEIKNKLSALADEYEEM